ncbi:hypothetical protein [Solidesulfovibrio sp.]|uniref:hypothetical protein n=1 Tax=Solidesulfovibrio sp. TaxID=2910990 RepID=UPI00261F6838|nr:hypothetical protein [Solidesulfovibrio sp.]
MRSPRLDKAAAFASGLLLVAWIGGGCGAAAYKAVYWLLFDAWPETALYGLVPAPAVRWVLALPREEPLSRLLYGTLDTDLLTYILVVPPLLLVPCLGWLLAGRGPGPAWRAAMRPFTPSDRPGDPKSKRPGMDFFRRGRGIPDAEEGRKSIKCG